MHPTIERAVDGLGPLLDFLSRIPWQLWVAIIAGLLITIAAVIYTIVFVAAPVPRASLRIEENYITRLSNGQTTEPRKLPCWQYTYLSRKALAERKTPGVDKDDVEPAEVFMSLIVPAYNEQDRIRPMLEEALAFLNREYGSGRSTGTRAETSGSARRRRVDGATDQPNGRTASHASGFEVLVVSDGSTDKTADVVLEFAQQQPEGAVRLVTLESNRGKGGAVTHGMRHVRGEYAVFADADGASKFDDLGKLVAACRAIEDEHGRAVVVGSRSHLVGSEAVVKRSKLRNFLMHSFHLLLWLLTPPATSRIKDTQCGFKLFSRQSLPYIIPHMHSEGWIFDVEMLMLAESAGIPMDEVQVGWKEVGGSKLNVVWDSLGMAWGLAILRLAWGMGVYRV